MREHVRAVSVALALVLAGCSRLEPIDAWPFVEVEPETDRFPGRAAYLGPLFETLWKNSVEEHSVRPWYTTRTYYDVPPGQQPQWEVPYFTPPALLTTLARRTPPRTEPGKGDTGRQVLALYPIYVRECCGQMNRTTLLPFYYDWYDRSREGDRWHHSGVFPFYFRGETDQRGFYAAVPFFGGTLKNWFGRDTISMGGFPFYIRSTRDERVWHDVLGPLIGWTSGGGYEGWRVWPFVGRFKAPNKPAKWFFLWPFFWHTAGQGEEEEAGTRLSGVFPFWARLEKGAVTIRYVMWPFYSRAINHKTGRTDVVSWPFYRGGQGPDYSRTQYWPFYGYVDDGHVHRQYYIWPLFRYEQRETERMSWRGRSIFLLYRSFDAEWTDADGVRRKSRESKLLPFYFRREDGYGNSYYCALDLRGIPDQAYDRLYAPLWRVYERETRAADPAKGWSEWHSTRVLWGAYRHDRDAESSFLRVFPFISRRTSGGRTTSLRVLAGIYGYEDRPTDRTYRIFFIPWTMKKEGTK